MMTTRTLQPTATVADATPAAGRRIPAAGPDPCAVAVARRFRAAIDAEAVILFGSRSRGDWRPQSDIDLLVIARELPSPEAAYAGEKKASAIAAELYSGGIGIDFVYMSRADYERKSRRSLNSVARHARREGVIMPRDPADFVDPLPEEPETDLSEEYAERERRLGDANMHYLAMHSLLDAGMTDKNVVYQSHQALEHGMKALISALGYAYEPNHRLDLQAAAIRQYDPGTDWLFASDLVQLNNFAGGSRYGPLLTPVRDFAAMANAVTEDLTRLYRRIGELAGGETWAIPPEGTDYAAAPRYR